MKKRIVSLTLAAAMTVACTPVILAGCGGGEAIDYEHTIVFYSSQGDNLQKKTKVAIDNFQAKYPGWKVEHTPQGGYDEVKEKISTDLQGEGGGLQPDLAYCYPDHVAQYLQTEQVIDMNKYIYSTDVVTGVDESGAEKQYVVGYSENELKDFTPTFWKEGLAPNYSGYEKYHYADDAMLSLPFVKSTEALYYNADALAACKYEDGTALKPATTWDELWEQAPIIRKQFPSATVLGYDSEANWFINMCQQNDWGYTSVKEDKHYLFNENNADLKSWLGTLKTRYTDGWITTQAAYGSYTSTLFTNGPEKGGIVYCIGSTGGASYQQPKPNTFTAGVAPVPGSVQEDGTVVKSVISQGPSLVMFNAGHGVSNAEEKAKMTFLFIKELLDPTFQMSFSMESGYNPCRESVYDNKIYQDFLNKEDSVISAACKVARDSRENFFVSPAFIGSSTARTQVGNVVLYCMKGQRTADTALNIAYKNCGGK
ncbi:MAG: extracellular solute-binding protein [Clostridia bacterium]|nr:extracellular solute-binding protein [Clostridia bacterium]